MKGPWYLNQLNPNSNVILSPEDVHGPAGYQYDCGGFSSLLGILCLGSNKYKSQQKLKFKLPPRNSAWMLCLKIQSIYGSTQDQSPRLPTPPSDLASRKAPQTIGRQSHQSSLVVPREGHCWRQLQRFWLIFVVLCLLQSLERGKKSTTVCDIAFTACSQWVFAWNAALPSDYHLLTSMAKGRSKIRTLSLILICFLKYILLCLCEFPNLPVVLSSLENTGSFH